MEAKGKVTTLEEAKKAFDADKDADKTKTLAALNTAAKAVDSTHTDWAAAADVTEPAYGAVLTKANTAVTTANDAVTEKEEDITGLKKTAEEAKAAWEAESDPAQKANKQQAYDAAAQAVKTAEGALPALKTAAETAKKEAAEAKAAHDKAEAELSEARKGALLDYAATLEKAAATAKGKIPADTADAAYLEKKLAYNAAKMKAAKFNKLIVASDDAVRAAKDVTEAELIDYADNTLKAAQKVMQAAKSGHDVAKAIETAKTALEGEKTKQSN